MTNEININHNINLYFQGFNGETSNLILKVPQLAKLLMVRARLRGGGVSGNHLLNEYSRKTEKSW